ncbi:SbcC/MukB-like Walker B domain-containing protein [Rhodoferax sp.]|uniref:SbcC/MukB-like Walker B domain-containing protein n=1 Tax=Rhodoferax sp. TaxID=50421 RepID=UPI0026070ED3|nr:SbcC/MukB-like Walker B domain-containing protein [Rhodoferax sp.]MDD2919691.1 SbcC/MukB-like Walker B domain-containing protein [Rhodoferax sp.]
MKRLESVKLVQFLLYEQQEIRLEEITGLFGRNGSGKSSVLDAVQVAILGANKNLMHFNAQADAKSHQSRTLRSYCLGQYGDTIEQCARPQATTYVTLVWRDTDTNEPVSMGVCIEASLNNEAEKVLGRYVIRGVELSMSEHLQTVDGATMPLPWSSFRHRLLEQSKVTGEDPLFDDGASYVKQVLFMLRGKAGPASYDAFARAFRFALRMSFSKSVDQIVRQDVLEDRPTNIARFKQLVETFKRINLLVEGVEQKIKQGLEVSKNFDAALAEARKSATWTGLQASAAYELSNAAHEMLTAEKFDQEGVVGECTKGSTTADIALADWTLEVGQLTGLQSAHADHAENAGAQQALAQAQEKTTRREEELKQELRNIRHLLQDASTNELLAQWQPELALAAQQLGEFSWEQNRVDQDVLGQIIRGLGDTLQSAAKPLGKQYDLVKEDIRIAKERLSTIGLGMERANTNRAQVSEPTARLMHEFADHGLHPTPVCDLVKVTDPKWQPAIEAYLAKNVEAILLRDSEEEEKAFDIYQSLKGQRTIYGVKIVRSDRARPGYGQPAADTVASLIQGSNQVAVAYLRGKLGNLKRANTAQEALRGERTLTLDGMLVGPGDFERLRLVPEADLQIGAGAKGQVDGLRAESRTLIGKIAELMKREQSITRIRQAVQSLSSPESIRLLLSFAAQLGEALTEKELAIRRISGSTSAEYQALCAKLLAMQERKPGLEADARNARDAVIRAQADLERLTKECTAKLLELQGKRTVHETCRGHADYDSGYASDRWDSLLEQFGDNYQAMADHCESQSKRCSSAMVRHLGPAQTLLGTFLTDHREAVSDEVTSDWRKAKAWMEQQVTRLQNTELPQYKDQAQDAYLASQNTFRQDVALALHANLKYQTTTFKRLNDALKASPAFTNGERYQFQAKVRPDLMPLKKFIENIADFGADGGLFGEPGEIPAQFAELLREKTTTGNAAVKSPLDDYREFFEFDIEIETDDPVTGVTKTIGHLSKRIGPGSGGEHRAPLYVIAGAALSSAYRMDENNQDGLRLILLDEAFDKMDTPNIVATMRYLEKLGLQVLLASPGENLPTLTAFLHRYFEIMKDETQHVIQVEERRVSEAMREQFREDMWEYHPELLEAELLAVRQEPIPRPVAAPAP